MIEEDAKVLIEDMISKNFNDSSCHLILEDANRLCSEFESCNVNYVHCLSNLAAHLVAQKTPRENLDLENPDVFLR